MRDGNDRALVQPPLSKASVPTDESGRRTSNNGEGQCPAVRLTKSGSQFQPFGGSSSHFAWASSALSARPAITHSRQRRRHVFGEIRQDHVGARTFNREQRFVPAAREIEP